MFIQIISNNCKTSVKFLCVSFSLIWEKIDQALSPPPPCYSFGDSQATPDGVLLLDIALEKLQQTKAVMSGFCLASFPSPPPCSSQGRKVLRWKPRDARPPATTCSLPQPSAINSPPSKIYPALSDSYCRKSAPSLSIWKDFVFRKKKSQAFPEDLKDLPQTSHTKFRSKKVPFSFPISRWENDFLFSTSVSPKFEQVKRHQSGYPVGRKAGSRTPHCKL